MPTSARGKGGPVGVWITAAGWAGAGERRFGGACVISPDGVFSADEALVWATAGAPSRESRRRLRVRPPEPVITAAKDLLAWRSARRFRQGVAAAVGDVDKLEFVWQQHNLFNTAGIEIARGAGLPLVVFVDAPIVWEAERWGTRRPGWARALERIAESPALRAADIVACVSAEVAAAVEPFGVSSERIIVTPCSVDPQRFNASIRGSAVRRRYGLTDAIVVGWAGSFRPFHGVDMVVDAVAALRSDVPKVELLLIGDGVDRARIAARAKAAGIAAKFTGTVAHAAMPAHIAAMDIALVVDPAGGEFHYSPLKLSEYLAVGRAVIAPDHPSIAAWVRDGEHAILVAPGDRDALLDAIQRLAANAELRHQLGVGAAQLASRELVWDRQLDRVVEAFA